MPRIADYSIITDHVRTFQGSTTEEWNFGVNNDTHTASHGVFMCRLHITQQLQDLNMRFFLNGRQIFRFPEENKGRDIFTIHEIINPNHLRRGTNTFTVVVEGNGAGRINFSDAFVMFQRDI